MDRQQMTMDFRGEDRGLAGSRVTRSSVPAFDVPPRMCSSMTSC